MKLNYRFLTITSLLFISLLTESCRKEEQEEVPVTTDDAADVITYALESSSGGYAAQTTEAATFMDTEGLRVSSASLQCGIPFDSTLSVNYSGNVTATYSLGWDLLLTCNVQSVPQSLSFTSNYSGNYDGPVMQSSNSGNLNWTITGLATGNSNPYVFNGSFTRNGSHTSKVRNRTTFTSDLTINLTNVTVDKTTQQIISGSGSVVLNCESSTGIAYSFSGTIVFAGSGNATLTLNNTNYNISLY
jgi:hypothetical protein